MKKLMMAAAAALTIAQPVAAEQWRDVEIEVTGVRTGVNASDRKDNAINIYADPRSGCSLSFLYADFYNWKEFPELKKLEGKYDTVKVKIRVDNNNVWAYDDATHRFGHSSKYENSYDSIKLPIDLATLNEMIAGKKLIYKWEISPGVWSNTVRYSLDGSSEKLVEMWDVCQEEMIREKEEWS